MANGGRTAAGRGGKATPVRRRQPIDPAATNRVCSLLRAWPEETPLTWDAVVDAVAGSGKGTWTRQALSRHDAIVEAYHRRKDEIRAGRGKAKVVRDPAIVVLQRQLEAKEVEIGELKRVLARYEERFLTMIRNAAVRGVTEEELHRALPPIDRRRV